MNVASAMDVHARTARMQPYVLVHLTPYAPDCLHLQVDNPKRWRAFHGKTTQAVIRTLLSRLRRAPTEVRVRIEDAPLTDVDLIADVDGVSTPVATICSGISADEATSILKGLAAAKWRPSTIAGAES